MNLKSLIVETFDSIHMSYGHVSPEEHHELKDGDRIRHKEHGRVGVINYHKQHGNTMVTWDGDDEKSSVYPHNLEHEHPHPANDA